MLFKNSVLATITNLKFKDIDAHSFIYGLTTNTNTHALFTTLSGELKNMSIKNLQEVNLVNDSYGLISNSNIASSYMTASVVKNNYGTISSVKFTTGTALSGNLEFTIVNNGLYDDQNGYRIDNVLCPVINNPINVMYIDYDVFKENKNLISDEIYTNYSDHISTLLANSAVVDKNSFKYYDADDKYYRRRSNVIKLSNNIGEDYLNRIDAILYLWYKNVSDDVDDKTISLSSYDTIYLGDDFVLFNKDNEVIQYVLNYDTRAEEEIKLIIDSIN
jgi:hypothetical protein